MSTPQSSVGPLVLALIGAGQAGRSLAHFENILELGCGTGKNTEWLQEKTKALLAVEAVSERVDRDAMRVAGARAGV